MFASQNKLLSAKSASWRVDKKNEFVVFLYFVAHMAMCMLWIDSAYIFMSWSESEYNWLLPIINLSPPISLLANSSTYWFCFLEKCTHTHSLASNYIGSIALLRAIISTRNLRSLSPIMIKLDDLLHNLLESFTNWIARGWLGFVFNIHISLFLQSQLIFRIFQIVFLFIWLKSN